MKRSAEKGEEEEDSSSAKRQKRDDVADLAIDMTRESGSNSSGGSLEASNVDRMF